MGGTRDAFIYLQIHKYIGRSIYFRQIDYTYLMG